MSKRPARIAKSAAPNLVFDGQSIPLTLRLDRRAKRYIIRVDPFTGEVTVTSPSKKGRRTALSFAREQADWIVEKLAAVPPARVFGDGMTIPFRGVEHVIRHCPEERGAVWIRQTEHADKNYPEICVTGEEAYLPRRIEDWLKRQARIAIKQRLGVHAKTLGVETPSFGVRDPRSRWGSCTSQGRMSFSWRLILAPDYVLDYVVAHEVAHLREMNHGPEFWKLASRLTNCVKRAENWLKKNGPLLHRIGASDSTSHQT